MNLTDFFRRFSSACTAGSANQVLSHFSIPTCHTGRVYYRLSHSGQNVSLLFSNQIDSTFADGSVSRANDSGGTWKILSLRIGISARSGEEPHQWKSATFDGYEEKTVMPATGMFCTDPLPFPIEAGSYLCYEITLFGACFPYHEEIVLNVTKKNTNGMLIPDRRIPVPLMIGLDVPVTCRIGFLGDSITQGCGTALESYTHWVAKIAEQLPASRSVWNLGIGYARAQDAATDQGWLARAKMCDVVNICFGVNDLLHGRSAKDIVYDLSTILSVCKSAGCKTILFTVPPFDMIGEPMHRWYIVNTAIRENLQKNADAFFDFAAVLGQSAPYEHCSKYGGHPNAEGCAVLADAYLHANLL